jgi:hypothetical protein
MLRHIRQRQQDLRIRRIIARRSYGAEQELPYTGHGDSIAFQRLDE